MDENVYLDVSRQTQTLSGFICIVWVVKFIDLLNLVLNDKMVLIAKKGQHYGQNGNIYLYKINFLFDVQHDLQASTNFQGALSNKGQQPGDNKYIIQEWKRNGFHL